MNDNSNMRMPRDYRYHIFFRHLVELTGSKGNASHLFLELWSTLAIEANYTGRIGMFPRDYAETFSANVDIPNNQLAFDYLVQSKALVQRGEDYFCPLFEKLNQDLHPDHMTDARKGQIVAAYTKRRKRVEKTTAQLCAKLPLDLWVDSTGKRITAEEIIQTVILIRLIDWIRYGDERTAKEYDQDAILAAHRIVSDYSEAMLWVLLRRICLKRYSAQLSGDSLWILRHFDEIAGRVMPNDGFTTIRLKRT